jgi:hypothetical protein
MASKEFASLANREVKTTNFMKMILGVVIGFRSGYTGLPVLESLSRNRLAIKLRLNYACLTFIAALPGCSKGGGAYVFWQELSRIICSTQAFLML